MKKIIVKSCRFFVVILSHINVKWASKWLYLVTQKSWLNLKNPKKFNEKLMWLKLNNYNYNETVWKCADKYLMREYATSVGVKEENLPKIIKVYNSVDEIDFDSLPNKFALKCSHGCGFNIICTNKEELNIEEAKAKLNKWLNTKFGYESAEVHYTHVKPCIICEEFIENEEGEFPIDYKMYCFNGIPKLVLVCVDRKQHYETIFYDMNFKRMHLRDKESKKSVSKPKCFNEMIEISKKVSKEFTFVRVDFYEYKNRAILGELTFTPAACVAKYTKEASLKLGNMLEIKEKDRKKETK